MSQADRLIFATREACFAILAAIETDLRELIADWAIDFGDTSILPSDIRANAQLRYDLDQNSTGGGRADDLALLNYTDFGDLSKLLFGLNTHVQDLTGIDFRPLAAKLSSSVKERNRVCHSRPLEENDYAVFSGLAAFIFQNFHLFPWRALRSLQEQTSRDPRYVFQLQIPSFWRAGSKDTLNNLPIPDFDETTFLGRRDERREVQRLLLGEQRVISIVGEGGAGKTALALQSAYDLLGADGVGRFDAVVWISLKSRNLTIRGVQTMREAIADVLGVVSQTAKLLGMPSGDHADVASLESEILEYMTHFKVLLVVDNFETLTGNPLRDFMSRIPPGSKLLITSRVGLGELELRYKLDALEEKTAVVLMRRYASVLNLPIIEANTTAKLEKFARLLFRNPLLIKWFIQSVAAGDDPDHLTSRAGQRFQEALKFCFENLFERLSPAEKNILHLLAACRRQLTFTELMFLIREISSVEQIEIEASLATLHNSSMIKRSTPDARSVDTSIRLNLTDVAAEYISKFAPPRRALLDDVQVALKRLRELSEISLVQSEVYPYSIWTIHATNRDERISAAYLSRALQAYEAKDINAARTAVEEAKSILPRYVETYRVSAIVESGAGDLFKAAEELDTALEYEPKSALTYYQYSQHLLRALEDAPEALKKIEAAIEIDPKADTLVTFRALCLTRVGRCREAADAYEALLAVSEGRPRKWRITTADQAAECYRRWSEQDLSMREEDQFKRHLGRSLEIMEKAAADGDTDERSGALLASILEDALFFAIHAGDQPYAIAMLKRAADLSAVVTYFPSRRLTKIALKEYFGGDGTSISGVVEEISIPAFFPASPKPLHLQSLEGGEARSKGRIKAPFIAEKGFGFIVTARQDFFFHKSGLKKPSDWALLHVGKEVTYIEVLGPKGVQASDIELSG